ncbi:MAG: bifunctional diaminohydroxyphosphoribosylaminopyrimidine deaminase/5-amino-6-(5-phosphoribosylamino)uracil reductase RibD [Treponema sp.]|jgi:diaminohydroxyphosphoribosylaminopyrimidine deaminase/5-amino-6-(5-phosphoribosylamino)uracil reductase|nr:bifunctional diaminohydroxyphosphoribosylaminopyrimidine deaminase/5-amino-6-(5-phosphoribosylamino)uracil reductase RibD [Treponema sp.]
MKKANEPEGFSGFDRKCMFRAMSLARRGAGKTSPNPLAGSVVAKNTRIIGEGWHRRYGGKHAEPDALDAVLAAGESPAGADLYCTLEPCCFTAPDKHQPPCTDRIIKSRIRRVLIANRDPNPRVNGGGIRMLEQAGIAVQSGLLAAQGEKLNEGFFTFQRLGRPFIRLKIAQSLDGRIAAAGGDSRWITGEAARRLVHRLRSGHDAVLIGRGTALADDPELTVRLVRGANPLRVVLDSRLSLPDSARLLGLSDREKTLIFCAAGADPRRIAILQNRGIRVIPIDAGEGIGLSLQRVLDVLADLGVRSVLVEGGAEIFTGFLKQGLWDRLAVFIAPLVLGQGISAVGDLGIKAVKDALHIQDVSFRTIGDQALFEGARTASREGTRVYRDC